MGIGELLFVIALAGGMLGSGILLGIKTKKWFMLWTYLSFFCCFGFWEWRSVATTGESMSQTVGAFGVSHPILFVVFIAMNLIAWGALMLHFNAMRK